MTTGFPAQQLEPGNQGPPGGPALRAMLEARSVALVGASMRPGSFGARMLAEVMKSPAGPAVYPVNPRYAVIEGLRCYPSLADLPAPPDLVLLGVPDAAVERQLALAAGLGARSAVIFGNAHEDPPRRAAPEPDPVPEDLAGPAGQIRSPDRPKELPGPNGLTGPGGGSWSASPPSPAGAPVPAGSLLPADAGTVSGPGGARMPLRQRLAAIAREAGMELCGAGCMGFANVGYGLRAMGYVEPDPIPAGPVALVTHSGSVFSTLLRTRRAFGFTLAVSSGQELVTSAASYLGYALDQPETRILALVLEAIRQPARLRQVLALAAERDLPVVLLTAGHSASGRAMVAAHSGALAGSDGAWEALVRAYGLHRVGDLAELADTLELFALRTRRRLRPARDRSDGNRPSPDGGQHQLPAPRGIATVHDSGLERAHAVDLAAEIGVPFAPLSEATVARLSDLLDPGLLPTNPLDVWGTGSGTRELFAASLTTLASDESVDAVALAVDLITELDGDTAYQLAVLDAAQSTDKQLAVISNLASSIDHDTAALLRGRGIPVLEGMRTGLLALRHLLNHDTWQPSGREPVAQADPARAGRARALLALAPGTGAAQLDLLREYGIPATRAEQVSDADTAAAAAARIGYPVVLKTDAPGIAHKSDAGGVVLGIGDEGRLRAAYADLAARLGPEALVCQTVPPGVELALGLVRDPALGPLIVVGAGGILVELISDRAVALPPVSEVQAADLLGGLNVSRLLAGARGMPPADLGAIARAVASLSDLACEVGDDLDALDINPLICGPHGAVAVDALVIPRLPDPSRG